MREQLRQSQPELEFDWPEKHHGEYHGVLLLVDHTVKRAMQNAMLEVPRRRKVARLMPESVAKSQMVG